MEEEKACYSLISDIDHVGGHVPGSITLKKYLRIEIWSLISYIGAPSWFITFTPADNMHLICLYYAEHSSNMISNNKSDYSDCGGTAMETSWDTVVDCYT